MISVPRRDGDRRASSTSATAPADAFARPGPVLTSTAAELLAAEVARLRALMEREFTERRREAADDTDEDARLAIGEDEMVVRARIAQMESLLRQATVVHHEPSGEDVVGLGSQVTLEDVASGRSTTHEVIAWQDGAGAGVVSAASPVGQAILGRAAGEEVDVQLPGGRTRRLRIVAVETVAEDVAR
ncbi:MAG: GreA/GreB family elongation factor [Solirubrobacteraceae bacterium]|nr:GreA/GreB family elongation factor [Solirubrobacteraceae bacterium]